jgi:hypothetical protein
MRAAKTVEIGSLKTVARGIRSLTLARFPDGHHRRSPVSVPHVGFDKRARDVHPGWTMTTARIRIPALSGLILFVVILILP